MIARVQPIVDAIPVPLPDGQRFVIAVAGPPAAGKTTLAESLRSELSRRPEPVHSALLQLDAFHFDDAVLIARGHRDRKGASHTFDVAAYRRMLETLRSEPELEISVPTFDRELELSRNCAEVVTPQHRIVITEGNYLLLDEPPWSDLRSVFDLTVWVDVPESEVEKRILSRWIDHGLAEVDARTRWAQNDGPNADVVRQRSRPADVVIAATG